MVWPWAGCITWTNDDPIHWCIYLGPLILKWIIFAPNCIHYKMWNEIIYQFCLAPIYFLNQLWRWRRQMETFSALLAICAGNSPVPGEFPAQRPVTWSFHVFFDLRLNKRLSKQSQGWWFETLSRPLGLCSNDSIYRYIHITPEGDEWVYTHQVMSYCNTTIYIFIS